jgi:hypothetical protein
MEKIISHEKAILAIINQQQPVRLKDVGCYVIKDTEKHHYQILIDSWTIKEKHELKIFMHFHIHQNGKIYIYENHSSMDIGEALVEKGISKSDIVLAFLPDYAREYSGYAVA